MSKDNDLFDELAGTSHAESKQLPRRIGNYVLKRMLGEGGMGQVFLGENVELKEPAAIKLLPNHLASDPKFVDRFRDEARKLRRLQHPHIVQAHDFGREKDEFYLVMEYVNGGDLSELLEKTPRGMEPEKVKDLMLEIISAVKTAHKTTIHRDLSPNNILLTEEGRVKVSDFGLSEVVGEEYARSLVQKSITISQVGFAETITSEENRRASNIVGKVRYMSPQVSRGEPADRRNDIYALGIIIYDLLTGKTAGMIRALRKVNPDLDPAWQEIFDRCTADDLEERYQAVEELEEAIHAIGQKVEKPRKSKLPALLCLFVAGALGGAGYYYQAPIIAFIESLFPDQDPTPPPLPPAPLDGVTLQPIGLPEGFRLEVVNAPEAAPHIFNSIADFALPVLDDGAEDYRIRFTHPDYLATTFTIPSREGQHAVDIQLTRIRQHKEFTITSDPSGATVHFENKVIGTTPLNTALTFQRSGQDAPYSPIDLSLELSGHQAAEITVNLESSKFLPTAQLEAIHQQRNLSILLPGDVPLKMVYIPSGAFEAGSPPSEIGHIQRSEEQMTVTISKAFYIGSTEITRDQYRALMSSDPSYYKRDGNVPVDQILFPKLTGRDGFLERLTEFLQKNGYEGWRATLPTNHEWEYAARNGKSDTTYYNGKNITSDDFDDGLTPLAVYLEKETAPAGSKQPNEWGLYDMLGNLSEWTAEGDLRGGSYKQPAKIVRPAYRLQGKDKRARPDNRSREYGFRVVLRAPSQ